MNKKEVGVAYLLGYSKSPKELIELPTELRRIDGILFGCFSIFSKDYRHIWVGMEGSVLLIVDGELGGVQHNSLLWEEDTLNFRGSCRPRICLKLDFNTRRTFLIDISGKQCLFRVAVDNKGVVSADQISMPFS